MKVLPGGALKPGLAMTSLSLYINHTNNTELPLKYPANSTVHLYVKLMIVKTVLVIM